jgi:enoyl-CoA hydratase/carnithine racemase
VDCPVNEPVLVRDQRGPVLVLRLNRPDARNALSPELISQLGLGLTAAEEDPDIRCVVLTGTGDRAFCAGMDLRSFKEKGAALDHSEPGTEAYLRFKRGDFALPVVGAANATAVAGGFELLLGCDMVVAADTARFALPEVKRGLIAGGGGVFVGQRIPLAVALELTLTGDEIGAERAFALGLVNQVVPANEVLDTAVALGERISANGPFALEATKRLVRAAVTDPGKARDLLAEWQPRIFGSEDAREGASAYVEKRPPVWKGR